MFQVPKGMLQTTWNAGTSSIIPQSFKSPRECYKQKSRSEPHTSFIRFKSPRECYKREGYTPRLVLQSYKFQVPKGMLQTNICSHTIIRSFFGVSSPQGNATNNVNCRKYESKTGCFKSPRECYKPRSGTLKEIDTPGFKSPRECYKLYKLRGFCPYNWWVSSPQGNATNNKHQGSLDSQRGVFQVPKGMLQTTLVLPWVTLISPFQVPKGMLQTNPFKEILEKQ